MRNRNYRANRQNRQSHGIGDKSNTFARGPRKTGSELIRNNNENAPTGQTFRPIAKISDFDGHQKTLKQAPRTPKAYNYHPEGKRGKRSRPTTNLDAKPGRGHHPTNLGAHAPIQGSKETPSRQQFTRNRHYKPEQSKSFGCKIYMGRQEERETHSGSAPSR